MSVKAIATPKSGIGAREPLVLVYVSTVIEKRTNNLALVPLKRAERYAKKYYQLTFPTEKKAIAAINDFINTLRGQQPNLRRFDVSTLSI
jgi:hypothetical protein